MYIYTYSTNKFNFFPKRSKQLTTLFGDDTFLPLFCLFKLSPTLLSLYLSILFFTVTLIPSSPPSLPPCQSLCSFSTLHNHVFLLQCHYLVTPHLSFPCVSVASPFPSPMTLRFLNPVHVLYPPLLPLSFPLFLPPYAILSRSIRHRLIRFLHFLFPRLFPTYHSLPSSLSPSFPFLLHTNQVSRTYTQIRTSTAHHPSFFCF